MTLEKRGTPKQKKFNDDMTVSYLLNILRSYDKIIPLFDNDINDDIQDIGCDLRYNLQNLKQIRNKIEMVMIAETLDETEKSPQLINFYISEMDKIFNKYIITEANINEETGTI